MSRILMMILAPIAAMLVQMKVSRSRAFLADEIGAQVSNNPLLPATVHMFIMNSLTGGVLLNLFSTHPPMEERITRHKAMVVRISVK
jgi:heat shock protein HtpX